MKKNKQKKERVGWEGGWGKAKEKAVLVPVPRATHSALADTERSLWIFPDTAVRACVCVLLSHEREHRVLSLSSQVIPSSCYAKVFSVNQISWEFIFQSTEEALTVFSSGLMDRDKLTYWRLRMPSV